MLYTSKWGQISATTDLSKLLKQGVSSPSAPKQVALPATPSKTIPTPKPCAKCGKRK